MFRSKPRTIIDGHSGAFLYNKRGFNSMAKEIKTVQLTMFYNGEVIVLDDFLDDKVEELNHLQLFLM
ncbi:hypothetical protein P8452_12993 [Trifolium repens]|nr:hypothetical protein P8452_12993 [Trifolium repens]